MEEIPGRGQLAWQEVHFFLAVVELSNKNKEQAGLFQSSHNDIPIKQSQSQLITGVARRENK